ncbi:MAG: SMC-Scp complex subunit ScpB [Ruminococcus sp.]|nr:SMC-Scp complex subunit ScpB [Ruminococcus sp.]
MTAFEGIAIAEAILFASGEPISRERIAEAAKIEISLADKLIRELEDRYEDTGSALTVLRLNDSYQLAVRREYYEYIRRAFDMRRAQPLSQAALEVLTIIAYNQPVTKSFVEHVRGVDSSSLVNNLTEKHLLEEAGRLDVPGKPIAYKTTDVFLRTFGLESLADLPPIPAGSGEQTVIDESFPATADGES